MSQYGVISGPYFPVFSSNTRKYRPEITLYLETFHAVVYLEPSWTPKMELSAKKLFLQKSSIVEVRLGSI